MLFDANPDARIRITAIGSEQQPVIQIDRLLRNPDALVDFAANDGQFGAVTDNLYPGIRAPMPLDYVNGAVRALDPLIREVMQLGDARLAHAECFYSLVTTPPEQLLPYQTIPHIDTVNPLHIAVVHFLCNGDFGGTAFFRQRATGFETIGPHREAAWSAARESALYKAAHPAGYIADQSEDYDRIALFDADYDRMLIYRSNQLHSGHIPDYERLSPSPRSGRLTANFFIGYREA